MALQARKVSGAFEKRLPVPTVQFCSLRRISCRQSGPSVSNINGSLFTLSSFKCFICVLYTLNRKQKHIFDVFKNLVWFGWITHSHGRFSCMLYRLQKVSTVI